MAVPFYIPSSNIEKIQFCCILAWDKSLSVHSSYSNRCVVIFHCDFHVHFPNGNWRWTSFLEVIFLLCILFGEISVCVFCPFSSEIVMLTNTAFNHFVLPHSCWGGEWKFSCPLGPPDTRIGGRRGRQIANSIAPHRGASPCCWHIGWKVSSPPATLIPRRAGISFGVLASVGLCEEKSILFC